MKDVIFAFEVHQPFRMDKDFFWERRMFKQKSREELFEYYFDNAVNRKIFERASKKCYLPTNRILLDLIDLYKHESKRVKLAFSLSGVFLEQCERFGRDVLEYFKQMAESGSVEFLEQTYYHSLSSLYTEKDEFEEQVTMHRNIMRDLLNYEPRFFENTELLYNNTVAKTVEEMGYLGIFTEGIERILGSRSPNHIYKAEECRELRVLLRNYKLTDDIGFRFSDRNWREWPLTAKKYVGWLKEAEGECLSIFPDYETFGEHHWPETGIQEFLAELIQEIVESEEVDLSTPSEVIKKYRPIGTVDVPDRKVVSWADLKRDASCWLGNTMQWAYYTSVRRLKPLVREAEDQFFLRVWRHLQTSDHLYYMFTGGGSPAEVHSYFSLFEKPVDAFLTAQAVIGDFEMRLRLFTVGVGDVFKFYTGIGKERYTGIEAWSLKGFIKALEKVDERSLRFHTLRGDFEKWAEFSLKCNRLAEEFRSIRESGLSGENLRYGLLRASKKCLGELQGKTQALAYY